MYEIRLATLDDVEELVRLRLDFLEEVGNFRDAVVPGEADMELAW